MSRYRRVTTLARMVGVLRSCVPSEVMREPPRTRPGRRAPDGTVRGPRKPPQDTCLLADCTRPHMPGDSICDVHARYYRFYCVDCGQFVRSDIAMERTGGTHCLPCWDRTPEGKARRIKLAKLRRRES